MQTHVLTSLDGWVLVSIAAVCRIQVLNSWHPGMLRVHVGPSLPDDDSPFFEVVQGENWIKTTDVDNVYVYAWRATAEHPLTITVSDKVDGAAAGGGGSAAAGLTDAELRAAPLETTAPATVSKIEELRLQLVTLLGNTDNLETLTASTNTLITNMITYVDQLETLSSSVVTNTADLTALLTDLGLNTDDIETILAEISAKLPSTLGKKTAANSLSVTLASDDGILDAINAVTAELQEKANLTETQPVSAASLPLPAGASTEARQVETLTSLTTVIARLQSILDELAPMTDGTLNNPVITRHIARAFTPGLLRVSAAGTVAVGAFEVSIANVGGVNGTVLGVTLAPDEVVTFRAPLPGSTLGAIAYVGTDTTLLINTLVEVV